MFQWNAAAHPSSYGSAGEYAPFYSNKDDQRGIAAKLVRRVRVAYRRDYALFSQLAESVAASDAAVPETAESKLTMQTTTGMAAAVGVQKKKAMIDPFEAELYFPPTKPRSLAAVEVDENRRRVNAAVNDAPLLPSAVRDPDDDEVMIRVWEPEPVPELGGT